MCAALIAVHVPAFLHDLHVPPRFCIDIFMRKWYDKRRRTALFLPLFKQPVFKYL